MKNTRIGAHEASAVLNSVPRSSMAAMLGHASASAMPTAKPMTMRLMRLIEPQTSTIFLKMPMERLFSQIRVAADGKAFVKQLCYRNGRKRWKLI